MAKLRDKVYSWSLNLIKEGKTFEGIFLMLSTWNFATFRYHVTSFDLVSFEKVFEKCRFDLFQGKSFVELNFNDKKICEDIRELYSALSKFKGIGPVGASKIMHFMCPECFVMWDSKIRTGYHFNTSPHDYLSFLQKMQEMYRNKKFSNLQKNVSIPRAIDIYNFEHFSI